MKKKEVVILELLIALLAIVVLMMNFADNQSARRLVITVDWEEYKSIALLPILMLISIVTGLIVGFSAKFTLKHFNLLLSKGTT
jgi:hypothetical protein